MDLLLQFGDKYFQARKHDWQMLGRVDEKKIDDANRLDDGALPPENIAVEWFLCWRRLHFLKLLDLNCIHAGEVVLDRGCERAGSIGVNKP